MGPTCYHIIVCMYNTYIYILYIYEYTGNIINIILSNVTPARLLPVFSNWALACSNCHLLGFWGASS